MARGVRGWLLQRGGRDTSCSQLARGRTTRDAPARLVEEESRRNSFWPLFIRGTCRNSRLELPFPATVKCLSRHTLLFSHPPVRILRAFPPQARSERHAPLVLRRTSLAPGCVPLAQPSQLMSGQVLCRSPVGPVISCGHRTTCSETRAAKADSAGAETKRLLSRRN
jgi:hypothetical protein